MRLNKNTKHLNVFFLFFFNLHFYNLFFSLVLINIFKANFKTIKNHLKSLNPISKILNCMLSLSVSVIYFSKEPLIVSVLHEFKDLIYVIYLDIQQTTLCPASKWARDLELLRVERYSQGFWWFMVQVCLQANEAWGFFSLY